MALWGKADSLYSGGTVSVNYTNKTITGSGTSFTAAGISTGTVITIGVGGTYGQAVISGITSATLVSIATTQYLSGAAISGVAYTMSQKPVYTLEDTNYSATQTTSTGLTNFIEGVDEYEAAALKATGSQYAVAHAGWVGVHTYVDMHGTLRVKSETLVAMSGISTNNPPTFTSTGDANDDATLPDRYITITTQPQSLTGVSTTSVQTISVSAQAVPDGTLSYQWQYQYPVGAAFTNLPATLNNVSYATTTTNAIGIGTTTVNANRPDGYLYRVIISTTGGAPSVTSSAATLDYV